MRNRILFFSSIFICAFLFIDETRAQTIPLPQKRPQYNANYFYYFTKPDGPTPILDNQKGMSFIPGDSLIRFKVIPNPVAGEANLMSFETVPLSASEKVITGKIPMASLGQQMGAMPTVENLKKYQMAMKAYSEIEKQKRIEKEKTMTYQDALKEFHNQNCPAGGMAQTEDGLTAKWESYIKNTMLSPRGQQLGKNAQLLDMSARTILFESQKKDEISNNPNPKALDCQRDLIALSARNRAFAKNWDDFGATTNGDVLGVVTNSQYNVWRKQFVQDNVAILACYLRDDYGKPDRAANYQAIVNQIPRTLGLDDPGKPPSDNNISDRFSVANPSMTPAPQIKEFTHYYHPRGLQKCNVTQRTSPEVTSGYIRITTPGKNGLPPTFQFLPIVNGEVQGQKNMRIVKKGERRDAYYGPAQVLFYEWKFDILIPDGANKWKQVPADTVFQGDVGLTDTSNLDEQYTVDDQACLPKGILPQCFDANKTNAAALNEQGYMVPYTWFNRTLRNDMSSSLQNLGFPNADQNFVAPPRYDKLNPSGVPIAIRCDSLGSGNQAPVFGGSCDTNLMMASGVDRMLPTIKPSSDATDNTTIDQ